MDSFQRAATKSSSGSTVLEKIRAFLLPLIVLALFLLLIFQFYLMGKTGSGSSDASGQPVSS